LQPKILAVWLSEWQWKVTQKFHNGLLTHTNTLAGKMKLAHLAVRPGRHPHQLSIGVITSNSKELASKAKFGWLPLFYTIRYLMNIKMLLPMKKVEM
jgi:hypothetical protein